MGVPRPARELLVVVNARASAAATAGALLARVTAAVARTGARPNGLVTTSESDLRSAFEGADSRRALLVGGDGTLHAAANLPLELPEIALVPAGRANNVARALGIPTRIEDAVAVAAESPARPLDVMRVDSGGQSLYCVEGLSGGIQAEARARYEGGNSGDLRAGARALVEALRGYRPYRAELTVDGMPAFAGEVAQVFVSNLRFFSFGFDVNPSGRPADGLVEAIVLRAASRRQALRRLLEVRGGRHLGRGWTNLVRAREARLEGPLPLVADSRPLGAGSASVRVVRDRLRVVSP